MNRRQVRDLIVASLESAGWRQSDGCTDDRAEVHCGAGPLRLDVVQAPNEDDDPVEALFVAVSRPNTPGLPLIVFFGDKLPDLLQVLAGAARSIAPDNYDELLRALVQLCPETYVETDGELTLVTMERQP
jgi:hypothetical protein